MQVKPHLVFNANLDLLLGWGNHFILYLAFQVRQFRHGIMDDLQRLLNLLLGNDQRWCQTDDVLVGWFGLNKSSQHDPRIYL